MSYSNTNLFKHFLRCRMLQYPHCILPKGTFSCISIPGGALHCQVEHHVRLKKIKILIFFKATTFLI